MTAELHDVEAIHIGRYDLEAERYVLGAILATSGRALFEIGQLAPADFFRPEHEQLFALMHGMHGRGDVVEVQAVAQRLVGSPIRGIGLPQLVDMFSSCVTAANASYYAQTVRQLGRLRRLQAASMRIAQMTGSCDISAVDEVVEQARAEIDSAGDNSTRARSAHWANFCRRRCSDGSRLRRGSCRLGCWTSMTCWPAACDRGIC